MSSIEGFNRWPDALVCALCVYVTTHVEHQPEFRPVMMSHYATCERASLRLLEVMAAALGLEDRTALHPYFQVVGTRNSQQSSHSTVTAAPLGVLQGQLLPAGAGCPTRRLWCQLPHRRRRADHPAAGCGGWVGSAPGWVLAPRPTPTRGPDHQRGGPAAGTCCKRAAISCTPSAP